MNDHDSAEPGTPASIARMATLTRALASWWEYYNEEFCRGQLREPMLVITNKSHELGSWDRDKRLLAISSTHLLQDPWHEVMDTLRHEMAHQYADEVLGATAERPHGDAFHRACSILRVSPAASARPGDGDPRPASSRDKAFAVIQKLLALTSSPNENEAATAMRKAHELLVKHNIELVELDQQRRFEVRQLGEVRRRHHAFEFRLGSILNSFFFVRVIWVPAFCVRTMVEGTVMEVSGTPENLQMAEHVHTYLSRVLEPLWQEHRRTSGLPGNRQRLRYFSGVLSGFFGKLREQSESIRQERGLVFRGDAELDAFHRWRNPTMRTERTGGRWSEAFEAGRRDGAHVRIERPLESGGEFGGYLG
ncbi:MAG: DUF2786 domain-containing protein [Planctomycetes bacterium]|nr:DUF2786 domain-containing protein [Planctomycetota bacterium]MCB9888527.1 DUF2786 domain-containing protein [Planctomycetota bacterium]